MGAGWAAKYPKILNDKEGGCTCGALTRVNLSGGEGYCVQHPRCVYVRDPHLQQGAEQCHQLDAIPVDAADEEPSVWTYRDVCGHNINTKGVQASTAERESLDASGISVRDAQAASMHCEATRAGELERRRAMSANGSEEVQW